MHILEVSCVAAAGEHAHGCVMLYECHALLVSAQHARPPSCSTKRKCPGWKGAVSRLLLRGEPAYPGQPAGSLCSAGPVPFSTATKNMHNEQRRFGAKINHTCTHAVTSEMHLTSFKAHFCTAGRFLCHPHPFSFLCIHMRSLMGLIGSVLSLQNNKGQTSKTIILNVNQLDEEKLVYALIEMRLGEGEFADLLCESREISRRRNRNKPTG